MHTQLGSYSMLFKTSMEGVVFLNCIFSNISYVLTCQDAEALVT